MSDLGFCPVCGHKLILKNQEHEGEVPFCESCQAYRYRMFNTAISAIVYHPDGDKIALIQQYGRKNNILVAGYVTQGEGVEDTLKREIKEELGLDVSWFSFNASEYYRPSNTLMVNFACKVDSADLDKVNYEIDHIEWYSIEEAKAKIYPNSLAQKFLLRWLDKNITVS